MSPEWMIAFDQMGRAAHGRRATPLSDPLERDEWRGLEWASNLVARFLNRRTKGPAAQSCHMTIDWSCAQRTASRRF